MSAPQPTHPSTGEAMKVGSGSNLSMDVRIADATALPLDDASADLAVAFMSLHDIDAMPAVVSEIARIPQPGGKVCLAIVHPINQFGRTFRAKSCRCTFRCGGGPSSSIPLL
jgi:ubiquinone/menaquinone biosynthesis C-methylase UbiE